MSSILEQELAFRKIMQEPGFRSQFEGSATKAIEAAFSKLIERYYLYQKISIDLPSVDVSVREGVVAVQKRDFKPRRAEDFAAQFSPVAPQHLKLLHEEIERRPWRSITRHQGEIIHKLLKSIRRAERVVSR